MRYYFEVWLRGFAKDYLRDISKNHDDTYHPHVTLVRPFSLIAEEDIVRDKVINYCKKKDPIPFSLRGKGAFNGSIQYVPVTSASRLLRFNDGLESCLNG